MDVHLRIGINTGEVLVGALRAGGDYTAMGDVVNTASRLQQIAGPDQVVVGAATHATALRGVRYEPLGPITVKGREEPVEAWRALAALAPPGHRHRRVETPIVGRDSEIAVLRAALATATTRRRAHLVIVTGEAGVGKTRLASELGHDRRVRAGRAGLERPVHPVRRDQRVVADRGDGRGGLRGRSHRSRGAGPELHPQRGARRCWGSTTTIPRSVASPRVSSTSCAKAAPARASTPPGRARRRCAPHLRSSPVWPTRNPWSSCSPTSTGATMWSSSSSPGCSRTLATQPVVLVGTTRPELTDRWSPPAGRHNTVYVNLDPLASEDTDDPPAVAAPRCRRRARLDPARPQRRQPVLHRRAGRDAGRGREPGDGRRPRAAGHPARAARRPPRSARPARPGHARGRCRDRQCRSPGSRSRRWRPGATPTPIPRSPAWPKRTCSSWWTTSSGFRNELTRDVAYGTLTKAERARRHGTVAKLIAEDAEANDRIEEVLDRLGYHFNLAAVADGRARCDRRPAQRHDPRRRALPAASRRAGRATRRLGDRGQVPEPRDPPRRPRRPRSPEWLRLDRCGRAPRRAARLARAPVTTSVQCKLLAESLDDANALATAQTMLGDVLFKEGDLAGSAKTLDEAVERWRDLDNPLGLGRRAPLPRHDRPLRRHARACRSVHRRGTGDLPVDRPSPR